MQTSIKQAYFAAVASSLKIFLIHCFKDLHSKNEFLDNWHIDAIVYLLEQAILGKEQRIIINLPPRHLKSLLVSVVLPAFLLAHDPTVKIICISYSDDLAKALARDFRRIVTSDWYQAMFPNVAIIKDTETEFVTEQGGFRFATSVEGTVTGKGADFIIIDDPIKPEDARRDKSRNKNNEWLTSTVFSRLEDKMRSVLIIVMQRLHVLDLSGYAEESGGFRKLSLPAIATQDEEIQVGENEFYFRKAGEVLHPERDTPESVLKIKEQMKPAFFNAQYQQQPECPDGKLFRRDYFQFVKATPRVTPQGLITISIDTALSTSDTADYTAITIVYSDTSGHYVYRAERGRWEYEELKRKAMRYYEQLKPLPARLYFFIENNGLGIPLWQFLHRQGIHYHHYTPKVDKERRAYSVIELFECGRIFIVRDGKNDRWIEPFVNEFLTFPHNRHDDQVDTLTQMLNWAESIANPKGKIYFVGPE